MVAPRRDRANGAAPVAVLALLLLFLFGCDRSPDEAERRRILDAIDAVRDAPRQDSVRRSGLLDGLARQSVTVPEALRAREACVSAYRLLFEGDDMAGRLDRALARGGSPGPSFAEDLRAAEDKIIRAKAAMPGCELGLEALRHPRRG